MVDKYGFNQDRLGTVRRRTGQIGVEGKARLDRRDPFVARNARLVARGKFISQ